nr:hypothetical protein VITISV_038988 [Ipomoea trifida]
MFICSTLALFMAIDTTIEANHLYSFILYGYNFATHRKFGQQRGRTSLFTLRLPELARETSSEYEKLIVFPLPPWCQSATSATISISTDNFSRLSVALCCCCYDNNLINREDYRSHAIATPCHRSRRLPSPLTAVSITVVVSRPVATNRRPSPTPTTMYSRRLRCCLSSTLSLHCDVLVSISLCLVTCPEGPRDMLRDRGRGWEEMVGEEKWSPRQEPPGDDRGSNPSAVAGRLFSFTIRPGRLSLSSVAYEFTSIPGRVQFPFDFSLVAVTRIRASESHAFTHSDGERQSCEDLEEADGRTIGVRTQQRQIRVRLASSLFPNFVYSQQEELRALSVGALMER